MRHTAPTAARSGPCPGARSGEGPSTAMHRRRDLVASPEAPHRLGPRIAWARPPHRLGPAPRGRPAAARRPRSPISPPVRSRIVTPDAVDRWRELGSFIREQRYTARLSLRRLSELAGISNPYLSQVERGLRRPSADILQQIAKGLRISAEALYVQAGILDDRPADTGVRSALLADAELSERQKQVLIEIYESFRKENAAAAEAQAAEAAAQAAEAAEAAAEAAAAEATATAMAATTEAAAEAADDGRPSRKSWSAATAEAELAGQAEPSGNAAGVPGQNVPPIG